MKAVPKPDAVIDGTRHVAVVVEDPRIVVVESPGSADPGAARDALELLVKWAVRAHGSRRSVVDEALEVADFADRDAGDST